MNNGQDKVAEVAMANQVPVYDDDITGQESLGQVTSKIVHSTTWKLVARELRTL